MEIILSLAVTSLFRRTSMFTKKYKLLIMHSTDEEQDPEIAIQFYIYIFLQCAFSVSII